MNQIYLLYSHQSRNERGLPIIFSIEPGGFRTDWAGRSMTLPEKRHPAYDHIDAQEVMDARHRTQAGDPIKGRRPCMSLLLWRIHRCESSLVRMPAKRSWGRSRRRERTLGSMRRYQIVQMWRATRLRKLCQ